MGADDAVVVDADRNQLRVAKAVRRRVATAAGVVVVEAADAVKRRPRLARFRSIGRPSFSRNLDSIWPVNPYALRTLASSSSSTLLLSAQRAEEGPPNIPATSIAMALDRMRFDLEKLSRPSQETTEVCPFLAAAAITGSRTVRNQSPRPPLTSSARAGRS
jgi:hypothetical protein